MLGCAANFLPFQIDVAVNAPAAGTIKEFLANEEDTVTVGQDLVRLELGGEAPKSESKSEDAAPSKEESKPEPTKTEESKPKDESSPPPPPPQEKKSEPKKEAAPKPTPSKNEPAPSSSTSALGNREERRVCVF